LGAAELGLSLERVLKFSSTRHFFPKIAYFALIPAIVTLANPLKFFSKEGR
jgi:hypothetical protein